MYYNSPNASGYAIEEIVIPASVGGISEDFADTGSHAGPQRYTVSPDNPLYVDAYGVIFTKYMQNLVCYPMRRPGTYYAVPATVNKVLPNAFRLNQTLRFLDLSGMRGTWIRDYTCLWMTSVEHINLPPNTTRLFYQALGTTHRLEKIFIPASASLFESNSLDATKVGTVYTDSASAPIVAYAAQKGIDCVVLEGHEHSYDTREYVERTDCSIPGFAIDVCECGQFRYTALEADHTPGAPVETVVRAATCSVKGEKSVVVKCVDCGETLSETTAPIDFDPTNHADYGTATENAVTATCHSDGYTGDVVCARCRAVLTPGTAISKDTVAHVWDAGEITLSPTCSATGTRLHRCTATGCTATWEETLDADPDAHVFSVSVTEPTCTKGGYTTHACTLCPYSYTDASTPARGHAYSETVTPPTCMAGGYTTCTCSRCGDTYTKDRTPSVDHVDKNGDGRCDYGCGTAITTVDPGTSGGSNACPLCGETHTGFLGSIVGFFHRIAYFFQHLFGG